MKATIKKISMNGHLEPKNKINFEIAKNQSGLFIVFVEGNNQLGETYESEKDALSAIETYMKTPFNMCGMPCNT